MKVLKFGMFVFVSGFLWSCRTTDPETASVRTPPAGSNQATVEGEQFDFFVYEEAECAAAKKFLSYEDEGGYYVMEANIELNDDIAIINSVEFPILCVEEISELVGSLSVDSVDSFYSFLYLSIITGNLIVNLDGEMDDEAIIDDVVEIDGDIEFIMASSSEESSPKNLLVGLCSLETFSGNIVSNRPITSVEAPFLDAVELSVKYDGTATDVSVVKSSDICDFN